METWNAFIVSNEFHYQHYLLVYPLPGQSLCKANDPHVTYEVLQTQYTLLCWRVLFWYYLALRDALPVFQTNDYYSFIHSLSHSAVCLTTGPYPLPKPVLHRVRSCVFFFNFQHSLVSFRSSSSWLPPHPRLPVTVIIPSTLASITCVRKQFQSKMWPIQLAFLLFIVSEIFLTFLTLCKTSLLTEPVQIHPSPAPLFKTFQVFVIYLPMCPIFSTTQSCAPNVALE